MMDSSLIAAVFCFVVLVYLFQQFILKSKKTSYVSENSKTPGLLRLPETSLVKAVLWTILCGKCRYLNLIQYANKNESVVAATLINKRYVFVGDVALGKKFFNNPLCCARQNTDLFQLYAQCYGLILNSGEEWKEHQKFCKFHLRQFGFGTKSMEKHIHYEIDQLLETWSLRSKTKERFSPNKEFYIPVLNTVYVLLCGERASEKTAKILLKFFEAIANYGSLSNVILTATDLKLATLLFIHKWIPIFPAIKKATEAVAHLQSDINETISTRRKIHVFDESPTDLLDAYLNEFEKDKDPRSVFSPPGRDKHLATVMLDLIFGGGDTTSNTLAWAVLHLSRNPDIQQKIWAEIDAVVGKDRRPFLSDRPDCIYIEAFLTEVLRFNPMLSLGLPHETSEDTTVANYFVPKGTSILLNIYKIQHDPKVWGDPENFRPERFLSPDGKSVVRNEAMCAFSMGPRRCLGEQVARDNLFLFVSSICQRFHIKSDPLMKKEPEFLDSNSYAHVPNKFYIVACDRMDENNN